MRQVNGPTTGERQTSESPSSVYNDYKQSTPSNSSRKAPVVGRHGQKKPLNMSDCATRPHEPRSFESRGALVVWFTIESTSAGWQSRVHSGRCSDTRHERSTDERAETGYMSNKSLTKRLGTTYGGLCEAPERGMDYIAGRDP